MLAHVYHILATDAPVAVLAIQHDVSEQTVRNIKMLKTKVARDVAIQMAERGEKIYRLWPAKRFTKEQIAEIRHTKTSSTILAKQFKVSPSTIRMVRSGATYA